MNLVEQLRSGRFEYDLSIAQVVYYRLERKICHVLMRLVRGDPDETLESLYVEACKPG